MRLALAAVLEVLVGIVLHFYLYRIGLPELPVQPFIYQAC